MRRAWSILLTTSFALSIAAPLIAEASIFPDVPDSHIYRQAIERLAGLQIINGNPDGTFSPGRSVVRAELITLLYRAKGRTPDVNARGCFRDVQPGSWYEPYVCDAAAMHYVDGYNDGRFRPEKEVNRVEAIKMITQILDIPVDEVTDEQRGIVKFVDVSLAAWYTKYLFAAFHVGILPIAGQDGSRFYPEWPLLRGEAAQEISNALDVSIHAPSSSSSSSSSSSVESSSSSSSVQSSSEKSKSSASSTPTAPAAREVSFPFTHESAFTAKFPMVYRFTLSTDTVAQIHVKATHPENGSPACRLYRLEDDGFSDEYYLGDARDGMCTMRVALSAGSYQLELSPSTAGMLYSVSATKVKGDGNDGFREAKRVTKASPKTSVLEIEDFADWYTFTVTVATDLEFHVTSDVTLGCIVYGIDADYFGFQSPECNVVSRFTPGTYYVGVTHPLHDAITRHTYTVELRAAK